MRGDIHLGRGNKRGSFNHELRRSRDLFKSSLSSNLNSFMDMNISDDDDDDDDEDDGIVDFLRNCCCFKAAHGCLDRLRPRAGRIVREEEDDDDDMDFLLGLLLLLLLLLVVHLVVPLPLPLPLLVIRLIRRMAVLLQLLPMLVVVALEVDGRLIVVRLLRLEDDINLNTIIEQELLALLL